MFLTFKVMWPEYRRVFRKANSIYVSIWSILVSKFFVSLFWEFYCAFFKFWLVLRKSLWLVHSPCPMAVCVLALIFANRLPSLISLVPRGSYLVWPLPTTSRFSVLRKFPYWFQIDYHIPKEILGSDCHSEKGKIEN